MIIFLNHCGEAANLLSSYLQQLSDLPDIAHRQLMGADTLAFHVSFLWQDLCLSLCWPLVEQTHALIKYAEDKAFLVKLVQTLEAELPPPNTKTGLVLPKISAAYLKTHSKESHPFGDGFLFFLSRGC